MPHLLLITLPLSGRLNAACAMAKLLTRAGHDVTLVSHSRVEERARAEGLTFLALPESQPRESSGVPRRVRKLQAVGAAAFVRDLEELTPDLVIADMELHAYAMLSIGAEVTTILWTDMLSVFKRRGLPPLHRPLAPAPGFRGRVTEEWAWLRYRMWKLLRLRLLSLRQLGADQRFVLRTIAAETGFPLADEALWHEWLIPFSFRSLPLLNLNAVEFEFPHDPYPTMQYVGPILDRDRHERRPMSNADRAGLDRQIDARVSGEFSTLIYASFGAWHGSNELDLVHRLIDAVGSRPAWTMVLGLGDRTKFDDRRQLPDNVIVLDWAPQIEILATADLAIHHGGINTINECLANAVPTLAYPITGRDTVGAAERLEYHRLGQIGDRDHDTPAKITQRVEQILGDELIGQRAQTFRDIFEHHRDDQTVLKAIEAYL